MTKAEMKSFVREAKKQIRVDRVSDETVIVCDKSGTMGIVTHDTDLPEKLVACGAEITEDLRETAWGKIVIDELSNRKLMPCRSNRVTVSDDDFARTFLITYDPDYQSWPGSVICVNPAKLDVFRVQAISGSSCNKPIVIQGMDYWALVWPVRFDYKSSYVKDLQRIANAI